MDYSRLFRLTLLPIGRYDPYSVKFEINKFRYYVNYFCFLLNILCGLKAILILLVPGSNIVLYFQELYIIEHETQKGKHYLLNNLDLY